MTEYFFSSTEINMLKTGEHLYALCEENGLSVSLLERLLCISNQSIYNWFSGKSLPSLDNLLALSTLLDISMNDLLIYT